MIFWSKDLEFDYQHWPHWSLETFAKWKGIVCSPCFLQFSL